MVSLLRVVARRNANRVLRLYQMQFEALCHAPSSVAAPTFSLGRCQLEMHYLHFLFGPQWSRKVSSPHFRRFFTRCYLNMQWEWLFNLRFELSINHFWISCDELKINAISQGRPRSAISRRIERWGLLVYPFFSRIEDEFAFCTQHRHIFIDFPVAMQALKFLQPQKRVWIFFPFFTPLLVDGPRTFGKYQKRWKTEKKKGAEWLENRE